MFHRDHTSIIHAIKTIEEVLSLKYENDYQDEIKRLLEIIWFIHKIPLFLIII